MGDVQQYTCIRSGWERARCLSMAERKHDRHSRAAPTTTWDPGTTDVIEEASDFPVRACAGGWGVGGKEGANPSYGLARANSFQPGPEGLPMHRLRRASTVGGIRLPLAPR